MTMFGCCGCGTTPETGSCYERYHSGWRMGHGNVVKTIHQDFTATYLGYTQREERLYNSGGILQSTTVISQSYPNNYSYQSSVTESVEDGVFFSGEFISNPVDSFQSSSFVSTVNHSDGSYTDTYDMFYNRSANVRLSHGVALFEGNHPQLSSFASDSRLYIVSKEYYVDYSNQGLGTYIEDTSWLSYWSVIANANARINPTGYSIDPDGVGDMSQTVYLTFSSGVDNATATAANTKAAVDALRGSGPAANDSLSYVSGYNIDSQFDITCTTYANGSDNTICIVGQKNPSINGPTGCGYTEGNLSFGYESLYDNYTPFAQQETRPQVTLWDFIDSQSGTATGTLGPTQITFTVPDDNGFRVKYARETYNGVDSIKLYNSGSGNPFINANPFSPYLAELSISSDTYGPISVSDTKFPTNLFEQKLYEPGTYPWPIKKQDTYLFDETFEIFPENPAVAGLNTNLVNIRVDSGIAPTYRTASASGAYHHLQYDSSSNENFISGIPIQTTGITLNPWTGGNYTCEINDQKGFLTIDYIDIIPFDQVVDSVPCESIIGCDDTLAFTTNNLVHRTCGIKFYVSSLHGADLSDWLYYSSGQTQSYPSPIQIDGHDEWIFEDITGCTTSVSWHYDGSTYTTNVPVVEATATISGTMDDAELVVTMELIGLHSGGTFDGPYTFTMEGIDLTAVTGTTLADNAGQMSIELGTDGTNYGNTYYRIFSGPSGYDDLLGSGEFTSGSSPFPAQPLGSDTYVLRVLLNNKVS